MNGWGLTRRLAAGLIIVGFLVLIGSNMLARALLAPVRGVVPPAADLPFESISIPSESGSEIAGWIVPAHGQARGSVLLLHGIRSNRSGMVGRARFLRRAGYNCLLIDLQAHGESGGDRITLGRLESLDARSCFRFLRSRFPDVPAAVIGVSLGGAAASGSPSPGRFRERFLPGSRFQEPDHSGATHLRNRRSTRHTSRRAVVA